MKNRKTETNSRHHILLDRKKRDPERFIYTGMVYEEGTGIQLFKYNSNVCQETVNLVPSQTGNFEDTTYRYWLNIYGLYDTDSVVAICKKLNIHNLVTQDILDINQRPKFQEFDNFYFFTIKSVLPSTSEVITEQISFVLGKNFLVSFQERKADYFDHLRYRLREKQGIIRERGSDYLLFTMLESILDNYFKTLQQLEMDIAGLNMLDTTSEFSPDVLARIEQNKKHVNKIKKAIQPIKDFTLMLDREENQYIEKRHLKYFYEIKDLCLTLLDNCDTLETTLESSTNLFFSIQGHRMNQDMKTLTTVATIFIPLTFIAGIYGMNFINMPELGWKYGYLAFWMLIMVVFLGMFFYLRRKNWL